MQTVPEFFQGLIAQDFQENLDADLLREAASGELAAKAKKPQKSCTPSCKDKPTPPGCSGVGCPSKEKNKPTPPGCTGHKDRRCKTPKRKAAFLPEVEGWSIPPAPPAF
jgi:hypothetical protein